MYRCLFRRYSVLLLTAGVMLTGCQKEKHVITLIGTADLQGIMEPILQQYETNGSQRTCQGGGIARIATLLNAAKKENPEGTFVLSSGDDLMGRYFQTFRGEAIYSLMSQSGYTLYAPGNHEFDKGTERFAHALAYAGFETLCSDLKVENSALEGQCLPYRIFETEGARVGFFSLMTEELPLISIPGKVTLRNTNLLSARTLVSRLQAEQCDIIIAVTHIGLAQDMALAKAVGGIDVIFGGHSHTATQQPVRVGNTLIVNGGEEGAYVLKMMLPLNTRHRIEKEKVVYTLVPVTETVVPDPGVAASLEGYKAQLPAITVLGKTTVSWDLRTDTLRRGESSVANLINDLLRKKLNVDIVMNNAGAFRGKKVYPPGDITDKMLHEIDEFSNDAYVIKMEGKYIKEILERSAALYGRGGLMQVSGLRYTIDLKQQPQVLKANQDGTWSILVPGNRVTGIYSIQKDGTAVALDETKEYTLLSNAYLVSHAGDGYFWFGRYGTSQKNTYTTFYSIMASYLEQHAVMNPKPLDGRLKVML